MPTRPALAPWKQHDGGSVRIEIPGGSCEPDFNDHTYWPSPPVAFNGISICPTERVPKFDDDVGEGGGPPPTG
jgi:hypothetical protein